MKSMKHISILKSLGLIIFIFGLVLTIYGHIQTEQVHKYKDDETQNEDVTNETVERKNTNMLKYTKIFGPITIIIGLMLIVLVVCCEKGQKAKLEKHRSNIIEEQTDETITDIAQFGMIPFNAGITRFSLTNICTDMTNVHDLTLPPPSYDQIHNTTGSYVLSASISILFIHFNQWACHAQTTAKQRCINVCNVYATLFQHRLTMMCPLGMNILNFFARTYSMRVDTRTFKLRIMYD